MSLQKTLLYALVLISLLTLTGFNPHQQEDDIQIRITQIDTSAFPQVTVYLAATDSSGNPVGLDPARIQLLENEEEIPVDQILGAGEIESLTVLLAIDISGSMLYADKLQAAKTAAKDFVDQLRPSDQVGLLTFNTYIEYVQPITADHDQIRKAINGLEADHDTAMYDALIEGIGILSEVKGRKAILAITDGLDTLSQSTPESVLGSIDPGGLSISTVGLGDPEQDLAEYSAIDEEALLYLSENAGGVYGYANDQESLSELYQSYAVAYKSEYQLIYTSPSALRDGVNRVISVRLADAPRELSGSEVESVTYNPGGLVPEVSQPVPFTTFGVILAGLVALLFLPSLISLVPRPIQKASRNKKKPRVKLKD